MQRTAETIGKYGCYFLSIVKAGELLKGIKRDALRLFQRAVEKGWSGYENGEPLDDRISTQVIYKKVIANATKGKTT